MRAHYYCAIAAKMEPWVGRAPTSSCFANSRLVDFSLQGENVPLPRVPVIADSGGVGSLSTLWYGNRGDSPRRSVASFSFQRRQLGRKCWVRPPGRTRYPCATWARGEMGWPVGFAPTTGRFTFS